MFDHLANLLRAKLGHKTELARQLQIVKVFELYQAAVKKLFPEEAVTPVSLRSKILIVQVTSSVLASELRLREPGIIKMVNDQSSKEEIKRVVYRF